MSLAFVLLNNTTCVTVCVTTCVLSRSRHSVLLWHTFAVGVIAVSVCPILCSGFNLGMANEPRFCADSLAFVLLNNSFKASLVLNHTKGTSKALQTDLWHGS